MALLLDAPMSSVINGFDMAQANGISTPCDGLSSPIPGWLDIAIAPDGLPALRARVNPSDPVTYFGIRAEIDWVPEQPAERWYVLDVYMSAGFSGAEQMTFFQIHDSPDEGESPTKYPNFEMMTLAGKVFCTVPRDCPSELTSAGRIPAGQSVDLVTGRVVKVALHTNWMPDKTGYLEAFYDGHLIAREYYRASGYADEVGPYMKIGLYDIMHGGVTSTYEAWYRNVKVYSSGHTAKEVLGFEPPPAKLMQLI